jgi:carboxypeptidase PM20D1
MVKKFFWGGLAAVLLLAAALLANTVRQGSRQVAVQPLPVLAVDNAAAAQSLAAAVQARTISGLLDPEGTAAEFAKLREHLRTRYPLVHARLALETFTEHTLVYIWKGRQPALPAVALMAHQDVVPIAPGTEALWKLPPFAGQQREGFVYGRGTWDNKGNLIAQFEALERLLASGFAPDRTLMFVYGHDEEVGGSRGAQVVAKALAERGIRLHAVLDEGLVVTEGMLPGLKPPAALVGVAEKGSLSLQLTVQAAPGHSSLPPGPGQSAIGVLSAALARLDAQPLPGGITGVARQMFASLAPEMGGIQRLALSNLWLFAPVIEGMLAKGPSTNALLRTTTAITIVNAGNKENVLPGVAQAVVNLRLLPGDTAQAVAAWVQAQVADERVQIKPLGVGFEASRVSSDQAPLFLHIQQAVREVFPGAIVTPGLMLAATDGRHFEALADNVYRFTPVRAGPQDLSRFHGTNERLSVANLVEMIRFYHRLLQLAAQP